MSTNQKSLSYRDSGVDIDAGNELIERIKPAIKRTHRPGVLGGIGGFGALFELPVDQYKQPILVSGTDGVGTKLKLATELDKHDTIGIDLVAMCVNDIVVAGAEPLYFLDYYASGKLELEQATDVITGIAQGCELAGCALTGGETAEMPGMYAAGDYDLAGFAVGIVEKAEMLDPARVRPGDILLGLASSGPHSNGYSLIRKVIETTTADLSAELDDRTLGEALLAPTRIYVKSLLNLMRQTSVSALCHVTGGGLSENLPRVLPDGCVAQIHLDSWQQPAIFDWLQQRGNIVQQEMLRTFNCGIGMVVCLPPEQAEMACDILQAQGEVVYRIGEVTEGEGTPYVSYPERG